MTTYQGLEHIVLPHPLYAVNEEPIVTYDLTDSTGSNAQGSAPLASGLSIGVLISIEDLYDLDARITQYSIQEMFGNNKKAMHDAPGSSGETGTKRSYPITLDSLLLGNSYLIRATSYEGELDRTLQEYHEYELETPQLFNKDDYDLTIREGSVSTFSLADHLAFTQLDGGITYEVADNPHLDYVVDNEAGTITFTPKDTDFNTDERFDVKISAYTQYDGNTIQVGELVANTRVAAIADL